MEKSESSLSLPNKLRRKGGQPKGASRGLLTFYHSDAVAQEFANGSSELLTRLVAGTRTPDLDRVRRIWFGIRQRRSAVRFEENATMDL